jgi:hypothetical protein
VINASRPPRAAREKLVRALTLLSVYPVGACAEANVAAPASGRVPLRNVAAEPPAPEQVEARAARLAPCAIAEAPSSSWSEVQMRAAPVSLRLPSGYREESEPRPAGMQTWVSPHHTTLTLSVSDGGQFYIGGGSSTQVHQGSCALRAVDRLAAVNLFLLLGGRGTDTMFVATLDVPVQRDFWIGVGVLSLTESGRRQALAAVRTLAVQP